MTRTTGNWTQNEMAAIAQTDDLHVSPFRDDRKTYGTPTWIWSVVVDDGLYVRGYNGQQSRWIKRRFIRTPVVRAATVRVMPRG